jgi:hypothetical protein
MARDIMDRFCHNNECYLFTTLLFRPATVLIKERRQGVNGATQKKWCKVDP